jgi:hypothetical protein
MRVRYLVMPLLLTVVSAHAGDFLGRGNLSRETRVGERESSDVDSGLTPETPLVPPARRPGASLADQVDSSFSGSRGPGGPVEYRFTPTNIKNRYILDEVDPNGPYRHLKDKVGKEVSGEELGLSHAP